MHFDTFSCLVNHTSRLKKQEVLKFLCIWIQPMIQQILSKFSSDALKGETSPLDINVDDNMYNNNPSYCLSMMVPLASGRSAHVGWINNFSEQ